MKLIHATLALCCLSTVLPSQVVESARDRIRRKVDTMRQAMRDGLIREYNVYVKVRLKNGNRLRGVVKNGRFVELVDGIDFVSAARVSDKRAGMRVWYTVGANSYLFLRYRDIARYTIGSKLSDDQVKSIEHTLEQDLADTRENYRRMRAATRARSGQPTLKGGTGNTGASSKIPELDEAQARLLKDFPPSAGWGKAKLDRLKTRRITLGVYPDERESRFEKVYAEWAKAYDAQEEINKAKEEAKAQANSRATSKPSTGGGPPGFESHSGPKPPASKTGAPVTSKPPK
jgi:hypothetical protein